MRHIIFESVPHTHEIVIDEENAIISFSLRPNLNDFVFQLLGGTNMRAEYTAKECKISAFIKPNEKGWGYGRVFQLGKSQVENDWVTWDCKLPYRPDWKKLDEISASISDLSVAISLFESKGEEFKDHQFLSLDCVIVKSQDYLNGGSFSFFYSKEVLDFAATIWGDNWIESEKYLAILNCMKKIYAHVAGKKYFYMMRDDFHIGQHQANPRWPTFRVPGDCACISPEQHSFDEDYGARYSPHNVDSKIQQLSLLVGVIKLANMARKAEIKKS